MFCDCCRGPPAALCLRGEGGVCAGRALPVQCQLLRYAIAGDTRDFFRGSCAALCRCRRAEDAACPAVGRAAYVCLVRLDCRRPCARRLYLSSPGRRSAADCDWPLSAMVVNRVPTERIHRRNGCSGPGIAASPITLDCAQLAHSASIPAVGSILCRDAWGVCSRRVQSLVPDLGSGLHLSDECGVERLHWY